MQYTMKTGEVIVDEKGSHNANSNNCLKRKKLISVKNIFEVNARKLYLHKKTFTFKSTPDKPLYVYVKVERSY